VLRLNSNFALAQAISGLVLSGIGHWAGWNRGARRAPRLIPRNPLSAIFSAIAAYADFAGRNYEEASEPGGNPSATGLRR
jgi:hypothetical protein